MSGPGKPSSRDDCFAHFDEAFARLESERRPSQGVEVPRHQAPRLDLSEFEEALTNIDRQLDAYPPTQPADTSQPLPRPTLALVTPLPVGEPDVAPARVAAAPDDHWRPLNAPTTSAFPTAAAELADAGRCTRFGLRTAATFHTMRAAHCGRRALSVAVPLKDRDAEPSDWGSTLTALERRIADLTHWPAGPMRKAAKDFFGAVLVDARVLQAVDQRLDRDCAFDEHFAVVVLTTTCSFLQRLAPYVNEAQSARLTREQFAPSIPRP